MKAVVGSVAQSKRIQLAKAAASFARFAASSAADNQPSCGERQQCANAGFLRLASSAFGELMQGSKKKGKRRSAEEGEEEDDDGMMESEESDVKRLKMMM